MKILKLSSKGQITIPKKVRERLEIETGDNITFIFKGEDVTIQKVDLYKLL